MSDVLVPSWPRLSVEDAVQELAALVHQSPLTAASLVNMSVEGLRFYPTAPARIARGDLETLRSSVVRIAEAHGYPHVLGDPVGFDRQLAVLFAREVRMLPVEAADPEVWAFLALRVVPDVVIWRWPLELVEVDVAAAAGPDGERGSGRLVLPRSERILGGRRGMLREAWWRGRLLGEDACLRLPDADNFIQLTDRISLTGDRRIASLLVDAHLRRVKMRGYSQRMALRRALVLVGRAFGRLSIDAISDAEAKRVIEDAFDRAAVETRSSPPVASSDSASLDVDIDPELYGSDLPASEGVRLRFLQAAYPYAASLETALIVVSCEEITQLRLQAERHIEELGSPEIGRGLVADLTELIEEWPSLGDEAKAATHAALRYVIEPDDARADGEFGGLADDDEVVQALFDALDRPRSGA